MSTTLVLIAYACEPDGSGESSVGWNYLREAGAIFDQVHVVTRANNIEKLIDAGLSGVTVHGVEAGRFWLRVKRGQRFVHPYYLAWQRAARRKVRHLSSLVNGNLVVHHVTFASVSLQPSSILGAPDHAFKLLGPVGGTAEIDWRLGARLLPPKDLIRELVRELNIRRSLRSRSLQAILSTANEILVSTDLERFTDGNLRRSNQAGIARTELAELKDLPSGDGVSRDQTIIMSGRLEPFKGHRLVLQALCLLPGWRLDICGDGPDRPELERLTRRLGVAHRVTFHGRVDRAELFEKLSHSRVFVSASLRESGPLSAVEAYAAGCFVVYVSAGDIDNLVPADARHMLTPGLKYGDAVAALASAIQGARSFSQSPDLAHLESLTWENRVLDAYRRCDIGYN